MLGLYDVYGGTPDAAIRHATQVPLNDPVVLVPAMAAVTKHLGFAVTGTLSFQPPICLRAGPPRSIISAKVVSAGTSLPDILIAPPREPTAQQSGHDLRYEIAEDT